jgi:phage/plasmid-like protein (TIGR03299 family)
VWILAKLPGEIQVAGNDVADKYLLLCNSQDGHGAVQVKFTPVRVVCQNTVTMALAHGNAVHVTHTPNLTERLRQGERLLGIANKRFRILENRFRAMLHVRMDSLRLDQYLSRVFPEPHDPKDERAQARMSHGRRWAEYFFSHGNGNDLRSVVGTLWAAYNGVTEYVDHRVSAQHTPERRLNFPLVRRRIPSQGAGIAGGGATGGDLEQLGNLPRFAGEIDCKVFRPSWPRRPIFDTLRGGCLNFSVRP